MAAKRILSQLAAQNRALQALERAAVARIEPILTTALANLKPYLTVVFTNNPQTAPATLLDRPDISNLIETTVNAAVSQAKLQAQISAAAALQLGQQAATAQLDELGMLPGTPSAQVPQDYLDAVNARFDDAASQYKADLRHQIVQNASAVQVPTSYKQSDFGVNNVTAAYGELKGQAAAESVDKVLPDLIQRSELGVSAATQRAYSEASAQTYASAAETAGIQMGKMWVANWSDGHVPCPVCAALSGQVVPVDAEFVVPSHLKHKKFGKLTGPQAHPNCQCRLVPAPLEADETQEVKQAATVPTVKLPTVVKSSDIRKMPPKTFSKLLASWLVALANLMRKRKNNG